jgi:hypothetical protein
LELTCPQPLKKSGKAYHVSFRTENEDHLTELLPFPAPDPHFDGCLVGLPLVFLTTTLREGNFPSYSVYPTKGTPRTKYQRYTVALQVFDGLKAYYMPQNQEGQVLIVFLPKDNEMLANVFENFVALRKLVPWICKKMITWSKNVVVLSLTGM